MVDAEGAVPARALAGHVRAFLASSEPSDLQPVLGGIVQGTYNILQLVEELGSALTSTDGSTRARGTRLLAVVLTELPSGLLDESEEGFLATFFCDRLKDNASVPHVIAGFKALRTSDHVERIVRAAFTEMHTQSRTQDVRQRFFEFLDSVVRNHIDAIKPMGTDFVYGFIQQIDGEKDPRCLMIIFRLVPIVTANFDITRFAEELFEVTSCYFPITFTPPDDDEFGITQEDLILGLRACLASSPYFAPFSMELLTDKLTSSIKDTKIDCFKTIAACSPVYGARGIASDVSRVYSLIRAEFFQTSEEPMLSAALECLTALVATLAGEPDGTAATGQLHRLLEPVVSEAQQHLTDVDVGLIRIHGRLMTACCRAGPVPCSTVFTAYLPKLLLQYPEARAEKHRSAFLHIAAELLQANTHLARAGGGNGPEAKTKPELFTLFTSAVSSESATVRSRAIQGLRAVLASGLSMPQVVLTARRLADVTITDADSEVRFAALGACRQLCSSHAAVVVQQIVPEFFSAMTKALGGGKDRVQGTADVVKALAVFSAGTEVAVTVVPSLMNWLAATSSLAAGDLRECLTAVLCFAEQRQADSAKDGETYVIPLLRLFVKGANTKKEAFADLESLDSACKICSVVVRSLSLDVQRSLLALLSRVLVSGDVSGFLEASGAGITTPFQDGAGKQHTRLVTLLLPVLGCCSLGCMSTVDDAAPFLEPLQRLAFQAPGVEAASALAAAKCLACLANKVAEGEGLDALVAGLAASLGARLEGGVKDEASMERAVTTCAWATKALVMRAHAKRDLLASRLFALLGSPGIGKHTAALFAILLADQAAILNARCHARQRLMYKQRFFVEHEKELVEGYQTADQAVRGHYLQALAHLLAGIPKQVLLGALPPLFPLMLQSLTHMDDELKLSTLGALQLLGTDAPDLFLAHMRTLVPTLLGLTTHPRMVMRRAALQFLTGLTQLPNDKIAPFQREVTRGLVPALNDRKRLVRQDCVQCRNAWLVLDL